MNDKPELPETTTQKFTGLLVDEIKAGYGVTPYTGAGVSARSGIMVGASFTNYLTWVIFLCIGDKPHDIRADGWPSQPTSENIRKASTWIALQFVEICKRHQLNIESRGSEVKFASFVAPRDEFIAPELDTGPGHPVWTRPIVPRILKCSCPVLKLQDESIKRLLADKPITSYLDAPHEPFLRPDSRTGLAEVAIRAMFDWRAMLDFLSRVTVRASRAVLRERDKSVIDSFHQFITHGRKPNLTHSMLAHLAGPIRTRVLVTTNFDSLHEEAFATLGIPFEKHDVTLAQGLPAVETIRAATSIIKLHGSSTGTRADFSLDRAPKLEENEIFFRYIVGRAPEEAADHGSIPSHLLVIGASGDDIRCLHFIKYLLDNSADIKIFWVCFDPNEKRKVGHYFFESEYRDRIIVTVTDRSDLLLLELFQLLTLTLPKGGFSYHYSHDGPPAPWRSETAPEDLDEAVKKSITETVDGIVAASSGNSAHGFFGAIASCPTIRILKQRNTIDSKDVKKANLKIWESVFFRSDSTPENAAQAAEKALPVSWRKYCNVFDTGLTPVVTKIFRELRNEHRKETVWIEMEDFADVPGVIHELFHIISMHRGLFQLEHAVLLPNRLTKKRETIRDEWVLGAAPKEHDPEEQLVSLWEDVIEDAWRYLGGDFERYVVCFYGRNIPGSCVAWNESGFPWNENDYAELHLLMALLAQKKMNILYVPLTSQRVEDNNIKKWSQLRGLDKGAAKQTSRTPLEEDSINFKIRNPADDRALERREITLRIRRFRDTCKEVKISVRPLFLATQHTSRRSTTGVVDALLDRKIKLEAGLPGSPAEYELRLLHAVSLFRQSRPPSVFLTDPVFPSIHQFNPKGVDSDWAKQRDVAEWLEQYREAELMWRKPGGNSWMYRDALFGLRLILEEPGSSFGNLQRESLKRYRSRTHFWIARWYFRAFCSSNHETPLLESFYHFYQCILNLGTAEPRSEKDESVEVLPDLYRRQRTLRVLSEWIKVVRLGRQALLFWFDRPALEAWFSESARNEVVLKISEILEAIMKDSPEELDYGRHLLKMLSLELEGVHLSLQREPFIPLEALATGESSILPQSLHTRKIDIFSQAPDWSIAGNHVVSSEDANFVNQILPFLATSKEAVRDEMESKESSEERSTFLRIKTIVLGSLQGRKAYTEALPVRLAILKDVLYSLFREAKAYDFTNLARTPTEELRSSRRITPARLSDSRDKWKLITILGRTIIDLCAFCSPDLLVFDMNSRVSVLSLHALALGRLGRFFQAHRRLNEAHALLTRVHRRAGELPDFALIELRRSEVYLLEADQVERLLDLAEKCGNLDFREKWKDSEEFKAEAQERKVKGKPGANPDVPPLLWTQMLDIYALQDLPAEGAVNRLRRILVAKLDDAWASIETAEYLLSGQIRTSISWGRLCTLKLRFFALHSRKDTRAWKILAERRRQDLHREFSRWLRLGLANWPDDPYRQLRIAWYFLHAKANWTKSTDPNCLIFQEGEIDLQDVELLCGIGDEWNYGTEASKIRGLRKVFYSKISGESSPADDPERSDLRNWLKKLRCDTLAFDDPKANLGHKSSFPT